MTFVYAVTRLRCPPGRQDFLRPSLWLASWLPVRFSQHSAAPFRVATLCSLACVCGAVLALARPCRLRTVSCWGAGRSSALVRRPFVGFSLTIVDNIVPPGKRTLWIGWFYAMLPVGTACGVSASAVLCARRGPGWPSSWRTCFFAEVLLAVPFVVSLAWIPPSYEGTQRSSSTAAYASMRVAVKSLFLSARYLLVVLGLAAYCFAIGGVSVWAIPMLSQGPLHFSAASAAVIVGSVSAVCGIVGTVVGGAVVDAYGGSSGVRGACTCLLFSAVMMLIGVPAGLVALSTASHSFFFFSFCAFPLHAFFHNGTCQCLHPYCCRAGVTTLRRELFRFCHPPFGRLSFSYHCGVPLGSLREEVCRVPIRPLLRAWRCSAVHLASQGRGSRCLCGGAPTSARTLACLFGCLSSCSAVVCRTLRYPA
ncbi:major facilitator superfamily protein (MFS) [Strigomonas culicis]|uniref:Major facilitator superfamily protein (MFS) n=1 Tax=Strigomonas culicis TaxID=28005 RepID=S9W3Z4_9TRYP|nr:major facilitator superfamily protein (MFS) [Strigomonas culicis]|eukprot:EPY30575.1 major facilitator superfamily protein (MFS) [Strigomonas culicis]